MLRNLCFPRLVVGDAQRFNEAAASMLRNFCRTHMNAIIGLLSFNEAAASMLRNLARIGFASGA